MRVIFMGTPQFAVPSLHALLENSAVQVIAVVSQPDRPVGRKRILTPPPVKAAALAHGLPVLQPERLRHPDAVAQLSELKPDLIVTAAYGQILPKAVLELPKLGCVNIHASLLPKYRGGAPIQHAVMNGDRVTGVTMMYMAEGLDTGDMISKVEVPIEDNDTAGTMFEKLSAAGARLLIDTLPGLLAGRIQAVPQNDEEALYSPNITREQEMIDWNRSAVELWNQVRGLHPQPGAYTLWNGEVLKIWRCAKPEDGAVSPAGTVPGTLLSADEDGVAVAAGQGVLRILELQPSGKKAMEAAAFARGGLLKPGTVLGV